MYFVKAPEGFSVTALSYQPGLTCPSCGNAGTFEPPPGNHVYYTKGPQQHQISAHRCPNRACRFVIICVHKGGEILHTFPPRLIDFNTHDIPAPIVSTFREALNCHANECDTASAMMVRKTLEMLCAHAGATGATLYERIISLGNKVVIPPDLLDGMTHVRLLGNDAAHVESRDFENVGRDEVEAAIDLTKELLKAIFQYKRLADRLAKLKRPAPAN
jgi:hypothetical protein